MVSFAWLNLEMIQELLVIDDQEVPAPTSPLQVRKNTTIVMEKVRTRYQLYMVTK